jgi:hypothetical protein
MKSLVGCASAFMILARASKRLSVFFSMVIW